MDSAANFFAVGSKGAELHASLLPISNNNEKIIVKYYPNSFQETTLHQELLKEKVSQLIICGMMTHMCIDSTTRCAYELDYNPILISDACATCDLTYQSNKVKAKDVQAVFMSALTNFSQVISCEEYINQFC